MDFAGLSLNKKNKGFSLVEVLIAILIIGVAFTGFYTTFSLGARYIGESKNRLGAVALANEKMEIARNLKYDNVGLQGGVPAGNIPQDEDSSVNGKAYHVHTLIEYQDDPLDGVYPADPISNDYKVVKITISWQDSRGATQSINSVSRFVPPGLESTVGGAPLAINVKGSDDSPVPQASVHIVNTAVSPAINFTVETDNTGHLMIPAAPDSMNNYQITVSKSGYETVATVDPASVPYTPNYANASVLLNVLNVYDYIQDHLSSLTVQALDYQNNPVPDISFSIKGGKVIGRDTANVDVVNLNGNGTTDSAGKKEYPNISPGNYTVIMDANADFAFIDYDPSSQLFPLIPETSESYTLRMASKNTDALFLKVIDNATSSPIAGAQVTLTDADSKDVFSGKATSLSGILYYPDSATPLVPGVYTLKVEDPGYVTQTKSVTIDKLTQEEIKMVAN